MSTKNFFFLALLAVGTLMTYTACDSDPCKDKDCGNGECLVDACSCDTGWEYDNDGSCKVLKAGFRFDSTLQQAVVKTGYDLDPATGNAVLKAGYEYNATCDCAETIEKKFVGGYIATETCSLSGQATPYGVSIAHGANETDLLVTIKGAYGKDGNGNDFYQNVVNATVAGKTITIASQDPDGDGFRIEGTGTIDDSKTPFKIALSYKVTEVSNGQIDICNSTVLTKQ
jgi:hypothetical protein